jgi:hypothetical protein
MNIVKSMLFSSFRNQKAKISIVRFAEIIMKII